MPRGACFFSVWPPARRGQQRQTEGEGLAGAGTATAEDVLAGQGVRDGRGLDREGGGHAVLRELAHDALGQTEVGEGDGSGLGRLVDVAPFSGTTASISDWKWTCEMRNLPESQRHAPRLREFANDRLDAVSHG